MTRPPVVLVVCLGNICRSPTAEAALREAAAAADLPLEVRSAGTGSWHLGEPPDTRMRHAAAAAGLALTGTAAQVDAADLADADLVLAMDRSNLVDLERMAADAGVTVPIRLFREFDPDAAGHLDVPDPFYGSPGGFTEVVEIARRTAREVVAHLAADTAEEQRLPRAQPEARPGVSQRQVDGDSSDPDAHAGSDGTGGRWS